MEDIMSGICRGQVEAWYHSSILRIPHGLQQPTKRYLRQDEILTLFNGIVHIQEKVDGKLSSSNICEYDFGRPRIDIIEDMTGKNSCHKHLEYRELPPNKRIILDAIYIDPGAHVVMTPTGMHSLDYCIIDGSKLRLEQIYELLEMISKLPSHFGRDRIEGLVIKNYNDQIFGKWINAEFEDHINNNV